MHLGKVQGRAIRPTLPVGGPFHRVGVDVLQLPLTLEGNQYAVVFMTKWVEVFAIPNQKAETIARLLVEGVIYRHGAPQELLSDRDTNFLSELVAEVCALFEVHEEGPIPQDIIPIKTNGLCEKYAKTGEQYNQDCDRHLPYVLYAYRVTEQESTI